MKGKSSPASPLSDPGPTGAAYYRLSSLYHLYLSGWPETPPSTPTETTCGWLFLLR